MTCPWGTTVRPAVSSACSEPAVHEPRPAPTLSAWHPVPGAASVTLKGMTEQLSEIDEYGGIPGQGLVRTARIPWALEAGAEARRVVVLDLSARGLGEAIIDEVELVLSELVANSLRHASPLGDGTLRVHWKAKNDVVEIEVSDGGGQTTPAVRRPAPWAPSGRGLRIVRSLAHEWGVVEERGMVTVWAAIGGPSRRRVN